jgi:hypothetical protein
VPYPVVDSCALGPARRGLLTGRRRHFDELPPQPPGTVLVFQRNEVFSRPPVKYGEPTGDSGCPS